MEKSLDSAVKYALAIHKQRGLHSHLELGDSYGWMLLHDGVIKSTRVWEGKKDVARGNVTLSFNSLADKAPKKGWIGVVVAGMKPAHYFIVDYEIDILNETIAMTRDNFLKYFREVVR